MTDLVQGMTLIPLLWRAHVIPARTWKVFLYVPNTF